MQLFVGWFDCLRPSQSYSYVGKAINLTTLFSWARLTKRLLVLCAYTFAYWSAEGGSMFV